MSTHKFKTYEGDSEPGLDAVKAIDSINNGMAPMFNRKDHSKILRKEMKYQKTK